MSYLLVEFSQIWFTKCFIGFYILGNSHQFTKLDVEF